MNTNSAYPPPDLTYQVEQLEHETGDPWAKYERTLADAYQDRGPINYLVSGIIEAPSLNIWYGAPGCLKSMLLADLAVCIAGGVDWLPPAPWQPEAAPAMKVKQAPVIWIDFDNGKRRTDDRFAALGRARNLPADIPLFYYSMPIPWLDSGKAEHMGLLTNRVIAKGAVAVFADNLGLIKGKAKEVDDEMIPVLQAWRTLAEETGASSNPIHHERKSTGLKTRKGERLRGSSSIEGALDLALLVEREPQSDIITIESTKTRGVDVAPFSAIFTYTWKPDREKELQTAQFYGARIIDQSSNTAIEREIKAALENGPETKTNLAKAVHESLEDVGLNRIREMIDRMAADKRINTTEGKRGSIICST